MRRTQLITVAAAIFIAFELLVAVKINLSTRDELVQLRSRVHMLQRQTKMLKRELERSLR
jgi:hypothetical protein